MSCPVRTPANASQLRSFDAKVKQIYEKGEGFIKMMDYVNTHQLLSGDIKNNLVNPWASLDNLNDTIALITDGKYKDVNDLETAPSEVKTFVEMTLDKEIEMLHRSVNDFGKVLEDKALGSGFTDYISQLKKAKVSENVLNGLYTLNTKIGISPDMFHTNRYIMLRRHPVSEKMYAEYQLFSTGLQHAKSFILGYRKILNGASKELKIHRDTIAEMMAFFDDQNTAGKAGLREYIQERIDTRDFQKFFSNFYKTHTEIPDQSKQEVAINFLNQKLEEKNQLWKNINYGPTEDPMANIVDFTKMMNKKLSDMLQYKIDVTKKYNPDIADEDILTELENRYKEKLDNWSPRQGYIPTKMTNEDNDDIFDTLLDFRESDQSETDLTLTPILTFLKKRTSTMKNASNSLEVLEKNMMSLSFVYDRLAQYVMATTLKTAMNGERGQAFAEKDPSAFNSINFLADQMLKYMKHRDELSAPLKVLRNVGLALAGSPAMIIAFPGSALANVAGGMMSLYSKFGLQSFNQMMENFQNAPGGNKFEKLVHDYVSQNINLEHKQPGRLMDYISMVEDKPDSETGIVGLSKKYRDKIFNIYDFATSKGILSWWKPARAMTTAHGSEGWLRSQAAAVLYTKVHNELYLKYGEADLGKLKTDEMAKEIKDTVQKYRIDTYYDMAEGLGEFNQLNKPFWTWAKLKYADNLTDIVVGTAGALWGAFRQVAVHNMDRFTKSGISAFIGVKSKNSQVAAPYTELDPTKFMGNLNMQVGFMGAVALALLELATFLGGKKQIQVPLLANINPFQEVGAVAEGLIGIAASMTNLPVSEEVAEVGIDKLLQFVGGVAGGQALREMNELRSEGSDLTTFANILPFKQIAHLMSLPELVGEMHKGIVAKDFYDYRKEMTETLQNPYPWSNFLNDYLRTVTQVVPLVAAKGKDETQAAILNSYKAKSLTNIISSMFGFRVYADASKYYTAHWKKVELENMFSRLERESLYENYNYEKYEKYSVTDRMRYQVQKYGKFNPEYLYK